MTFRELLEEFRIPIAPAGHQHTTPGWVQFDCPWCTPNSGHWRMGYNEAGRFVNCWHCGGHPLVSTLVMATGQPASRLRELLGGLLKGPKTRSFALKEGEGAYRAPRGLSGLLQAHRRYLRSRGFNPEELERLWRIQAIGLGGRLRWRIFIPIYYKGEPVSWTTRSLSDEGTRYLSAKAEEEKVSHKKILYGLDYVRDRTIVSEGPFDVWAIGPGAVCTFGTAFKVQQEAIIGSIPVRYICYDGNEEAQKRAKKLCQHLAAFPGKTANIVLDAKDPAESRPKELRQLRALLRRP